MNKRYKGFIYWGWTDKDNGKLYICPYTNNILYRLWLWYIKKRDHLERRKNNEQY